MMRVLTVIGGLTVAIVAIGVVGHVVSWFYRTKEDGQW